MSSVYKLCISKLAGRDVASMKEYVANDLSNPEAAEHLVASLTKKMHLLCEQPFMGPELSTIMPDAVDERYLVHGSRLIIYEYKDDTVYILRVLYAKRDCVRILFGELHE